MSNELHLVRNERKEALHPFHLHLDRLAVAGLQP
jgi:hypothetical protein